MDKDSVLSELDPVWLQKARDELGEDEKERGSAIETLRTWVIQQPWLNSPIDDSFLLRFLRVRKFSQLCARQTLANYWTNRTKNPTWVCPAVDPTNPAILEIIKTGFFLYLPGNDGQGRKVIIERPGYINFGDFKKKYGIDVIMQAIFCMCDVLNMDARVHVNGYVWLHDSTNTSHDTTHIYNINTIKRIMPIFQRSYPNRIKSINIYNSNVLLGSLLRLAASLLNEKTNKRLHLHGKSMVSVYKEIEPSSLPREYLPDDYTGPCAGTIQDAIDNVVKDFSRPEVIEHVTELNSGKYGVDLDLQYKQKSDILTQSFRKLHVD